MVSRTMKFPFLMSLDLNRLLLGIPRQVNCLYFDRIVFTKTFLNAA